MIAPIPSVFRHVYAQVGRNQDGYQDVLVSTSGVDSNFAACNSKYIAICWDVRGGGAFGVLTLSGKGKVGTKAPLFEGHKAGVIDVAFCPFNDSVVASASEDATIKIWNVVVGAAGQVVGTKESLSTLAGHARRVARCVFNPLVDNSLASFGGENTVKVWDISQGACAATLKSPGMPQYMDICWSLDGNKLVLPAKDKQIHVFDVRSGAEVFAAVSHQGVKGSRAVWYDPLNYICTTGFEGSGGRMVIVRDVRQPDTKLAEEEVDHNSGILIPFLDPDHGLVTMFGRGDAAIKFYELRGSQPVLLSCSSSGIPEPVRAVAWAPKYFVNTEICEIDRFYSVMSSKALVPINVIVPRRGGDGMFQTDLYPDPVGPEASIDFAEWWGGGEPVARRISLADGRPESGPRDASMITPVASGVFGGGVAAAQSAALVAPPGPQAGGVAPAPSAGGVGLGPGAAARPGVMSKTPVAGSPAGNELQLAAKLTKVEEDKAHLEDDKAHLEEELRDAQDEIAKLRKRIEELEAKAKTSTSAPKERKGKLTAGPASGAERPEVPSSSGSGTATASESDGE